MNFFYLVSSFNVLIKKGIEIDKGRKSFFGFLENVEMVFLS